MTILNVVAARQVRIQKTCDNVTSDSSELALSHGPVGNAPGTAKFYHGRRFAWKPELRPEQMLSAQPWVSKRWILCFPSEDFVSAGIVSKPSDSEAYIKEKPGCFPSLRLQPLPCYRLPTMQPLSAPVKKHKIHVELKAISPKAQEHHGLNRLSRTYGIPLLRIFHLGDPHPLTIKSTIVLVRADNALSVLEKGLEKLAKIQQRYAASAEIERYASRRTSSPSPC